MEALRQSGQGGSRWRGRGLHPLTRAALATALAAVAALVAVAGNGGLRIAAPPAEASFHLMRIYGVMAGSGGDTTIQYVETCA